MRGVHDSTGAARFLESPSLGRGEPLRYVINLQSQSHMKELEEQVADKAELAVDQLRDRSGDSLDYSESSLSMVEDILAEASDFVEQMPEGQVDALVHILGCYILEVGRREFGGEYYWHDGRDQPVLVVGEPNYKIAILTFDKVRGRLLGDEADNIPFFYQGFATRARNPVPGSEVLYV